MLLVVDEQAGLVGLAEDTLSWVRPGFFALRYELIGGAGVLASIRVQGLGQEKHLVFEIAGKRWRIDIFPLSRPTAPIADEETATRIGTYRRDPGASVDFEDGSVFTFQSSGAGSSVKRACDGVSLFMIEKVESFPKWRADLKFNQEALASPRLPILLALACCRLAFH